MVDRAYILHKGQVLREGTPQQIIHDPDVKDVYLGESFA
jgi:lipopolysaccharide export system ATP-binding protein